MIKAPICYRCSIGKEVRHWSTQPCPAINTQKERLTGAINTPDSAINRAGVNRTGAVRVGADMGETPSRSQDKEADVPQPSPPRTPNRRSREAYNAYMKTYMTAYRERKAT